MTNAKVTLIDYTGAGRPDSMRHAANILMFTKATRLNMTPDLLAEIQGNPDRAVAEELAYMAKTIRSSWEFVDLTFLVSGVTRATAQQMTRTRTASFAMQSMRVADVRAIGVQMNPELSPEHKDIYATSAACSVAAYGLLVDTGAPLEDARGLLPLNTCCNLVVKYNLRSFADVLSARRSLRAQGEYHDIVAQMEAAVLEVWPWAEPFFADEHAVAIEMLENIAKELGGVVGKGHGWEIAKAIDLLRKSK